MNKIRIQVHLKKEALFPAAFENVTREQPCVFHSNLILFMKSGSTDVEEWLTG